MTDYEQNFFPCDIAVVGAGVSGVPAAVAAARAGAKVVLVEKRPVIGGTMCAGLGFPVCGLFESDTGKPPRLLNHGLAEELSQTVLAEDAQAVERMGRVYVLRCTAERFSAVYRDWLDDIPNVRLFTLISALKVEERSDRISAITFQSANGELVRAEPRTVIDCTGSAAVVQATSAECIEPKKPPLAGFALRIRNVVLDDLLPLKVPYTLQQVAEAEKLPPLSRFTVFTPGPPGSGCGICKISVPADTEGSAATRLAEKVFKVLCEALPEFCDAELIETSPAVLQREGIRIKGEYILTEDDVYTSRWFDDAAARGGWPMEYWDSEKGPQYRFAKEERGYDIPLRALRSVNIHNLWAAGRAISADSAALASVRVIGTAIATGEAAGLTAAKELL